jgi:hypothetical protein
MRIVGLGQGEMAVGVVGWDRWQSTWHFVSPLKDLPGATVAMWRREPGPDADQDFTPSCTRRQSGAEYIAVQCIAGSGQRASTEGGC